MNEIQDLIAAGAGAAVSLAFEYVPKLRDWYNALVDNKQKLVMLGVMAGLALGLFGLSCTPADLQVLRVTTCDQAGALVVLRGFFLAAGASQIAFLLEPKLK
jgi:hypothetical protein